MIDVIKQTPAEYSKQSRDYQVLARLYTSIYNFTKMYIDDMSVWDNNIDNKLTQLRAYTLNFRPKHAWELDALDGTVSCFKYLVARKGTLEAIEYCINILLRLYDLNDIPRVTYYESKGYLEIKIPAILAASGVVEDLFNYLLPAGLRFRLIPYIITDSVGKENIGYNTEVTTEIVNSSELGIFKYGNQDTSEYYSYESSENKGKNIYYNSINGEVV